MRNIKRLLEKPPKRPDVAATIATMLSCIMTLTKSIATWWSSSHMSGADLIVSLVSFGTLLVVGIKFVEQRYQKDEHLASALRTVDALIAMEEREAEAAAAKLLEKEREEQV